MIKSDDHYRAIEKDGVEPIVIMEQLAATLDTAKVPTDSALNIVLAQKHITRAGLKDGDEWAKDIQKAINYLTRAVTGGWVK